MPTLQISEERRYMSEFGEELKKEIELWNNTAPTEDVDGVRRERKVSEKRYSCDVSGIDMTITRYVGDKESAKLYLYMSVTDNTGCATAFIKKMKGGTREKVTVDNLRRFLDGLSTTYRERLETGSQYIPVLKRDKGFLEALVRFIDDPRMIELTKQGLMTPELYLQCTGRYSSSDLPWYARSYSTYDLRDYPTKVHTRLWKHILDYAMEGKDGLGKRTLSAALVEINNGYGESKLTGAPAFEYLADIFDEPFAIQCFDEYMDNYRMKRICKNTFKRIFAVDGNKDRWRDDAYWSNVMEDKDDPTPRFVRFEKNRFWEYILHSVQVGKGTDIEGYVDIWRDYLASTINVEGKVRDKYPEDLQVQHDIVVEQDALLQNFKDEERLKDITEVPSQICDIDMDGFQMRTLRTQREYLIEAQQNANCVASYVQRTVRGKCVICSLRPKGSDTTQLTVEVSPDYYLVQIRGKFNRMPTQKERELTNKIEKEIRRRWLEKEGKTE